MTSTGRRDSPAPHAAASDPSTLLTVVVPTFHREEQVVEAVHSALAAGVDDVEVLVFDDSPEGSAQANVEAVGDARVRYHRMAQPSGGRPALVRNEALRHACGRYVYFLDDDDQVFAGALGSMVAALEQQPGRGVAVGTVQCAGPDQAIRDRYNAWFGWAARTAKRLRWSRRLTVAVTLFHGTLIINSCCMIRTDLARALGGYDPEIDVYEDVDFYTRGIRRYGHVFVDRPVLRYSTGLPSIIHDLQGETQAIHDSYIRIHSKYRATNGLLDYRLMQVMGKFLPVGRADGDPGHPAS